MPGNPVVRQSKWLWAFAACWLGLFCSLPASADAVYVYTGNQLNLTLYGTPCSGICAIDATVTLAAPLGDSFNGVVSPLSFSINDGSSLGDSLNQTNALTSADIFSFVTDASGNIIGWDVGASNPSGSLLLATSTNDNNGSFDVAVPDNNVRYLFDSNPGTWAVTITPEPSSLLLLGTGLLGLGPLLRRLMHS